MRQLSRTTTATFLIGLVITGLLYAAARSLEQSRSRSEFEQVANARFSSIADSFDEGRHALHALHLLFAVGGVVPREKFEQYAGDIFSRSPYLQALIFHRFVSHEERATFERMRRSDIPAFTITERERGATVPAPERERYLVSDYVFPLSTPAQGAGMDIWSIPMLRTVVQTAIDTNRPAISGLLSLDINGGTTRSIVMVMPVFRPGPPPATVAGRREAVIGDTAVIMVPGELVKSNLARLGLLDRPGVSIKLLGMAQDNGPEPVFLSNTISPSVANSPAWVRWLLFPSFTATRPLDLGGSEWRMTVTVMDGTVTKALASLVTLILGVLLTLMAAAFAQVVAARRKRIEALVDERTADLRRATDALRLQTRAIESSANAVIIFDATRPGYPIEYVNPAYERMMGYTRDEIVGKNLTELAGRVDDQAAIAELRSAVRERREGQTLLRHRRKDGSPIYSELYVAPVNTPAGHTEHFVMTQYDVTAAKTYEAELERHARYDMLTGLCNRVLMSDRLEQAIAYSDAGGRPTWVAVFDLDQFKTVNDTLGHRAGNRLLQTIAMRIKEAVPATMTVARTGGDEFVLVMTDCANERQAESTVQKVMTAISAPVQVDAHSLVVTCSVGMAVYPADGADGEALFKHAELAMYRAKERGRNTVQFFTASMNEHALERLTLEAALRDALGKDQFELHYQPQVDPQTGWVVGMEALIRWKHPQLGMVRPDRFISVAEETGLIMPIGNWVLRTACRQSRAWEDAGWGRIRTAVNLSARQFADPRLKECIASVLAETDLQPSSLEIELTETMVMDNVDMAVRTMEELKSMGVRLSLDDFGTGYSSLSYLKQFPLDVLKIDRSFVADLPGSEPAGALVGGIISIAHGMHMQVIAEGVETEPQLSYLRMRGCDEVQGNLYSRPIPPAEFERILQTGRRVVPVPMPA